MLLITQPIGAVLAPTFRSIKEALAARILTIGSYKYGCQGFRASMIHLNFARPHARRQRLESSARSRAPAEPPRRTLVSSNVRNRTAGRRKRVPTTRRQDPAGARRLSSAGDGALHLRRPPSPGRVLTRETQPRRKLSDRSAAWLSSLPPAVVGQDHDATTGALCDRYDSAASWPRNTSRSSRSGMRALMTL